MLFGFTYLLIRLLEEILLKALQLGDDVIRFE